MDREYLEPKPEKPVRKGILAGFGLPLLDALPCLAPISAVKLPLEESVVRRAAAVACRATGETPPGMLDPIIVQLRYAALLG